MTLRVSFDRIRLARHVGYEPDSVAAADVDHVAEVPGTTECSAAK